MIKVIALFFACGVCALGQTNYFGTVMLSDGVSVIPNGSVATPAEVALVSVAAAAARAAAEVTYSDAVVVGGKVDTLALRAAALNGQAIVYGSCVSFGSQAIESPTNVTCTIIGMVNSSNTVEHAFYDFYVYYSDAMSGTGLELASAANATWAEASVLETELTTFAGTECYRMLLGLPVGADAQFIRATGDVMKAVVGQLTVLEGLTVNGVEGLTVTNALGVFRFGLLVELVEE